MLCAIFFFFFADEQLLQESMKKKELKPVDHSKISYINVRKNLYIIPKALAQAPDEQVSGFMYFVYVLDYADRYIRLAFFGVYPEKPRPPCFSLSACVGLAMHTAVPRYAPRASSPLLAVCCLPPPIHPSNPALRPLCS